MENKEKEPVIVRIKQFELCNEDTNHIQVDVYMNNNKDFSIDFQIDYGYFLFSNALHELFVNKTKNQLLEYLEVRGSILHISKEQDTIRMMVNKEKEPVIVRIECYALDSFSKYKLDITLDNKDKFNICVEFKYQCSIHTGFFNDMFKGKTENQLVEYLKDKRSSFKYGVAKASVIEENR